MRSWSVDNTFRKDQFGIHIFNPVPNSLRKTPMPTSIRVGAGTYLNNSLFTGLEAGNELRKQFDCQNRF